MMSGEYRNCSDYPPGSLFSLILYYLIGEEWKKELKMCHTVLTSKDSHYQMKHLIKCVKTNPTQVLE